MKYLWSFVLGSVFGFLIFCFMFHDNDCNETELTVQTNTLTQYGIKPAITNTNCPAIANELNQYRTGDGWISIKKNRIYAGLFERSWSIEYILPRRYKNSIGFLFGNGIGIGYNRLLFQRHEIGVTFIYNERTQIYANYRYLF